MVVLTATGGTGADPKLGPWSRDDRCTDHPGPRRRSGPDDRMVWRPGNALRMLVDDPPIVVP